jgi:cell division protein FtsB
MPRRANRRPVSEYVIAGALALLVLWLLWLLFGIARKEEIARHAVRDTKAELASLEERKATLKENLAELDTERGQEATLRETYGVAKPGEGVIIVVPPKEATTTPNLPWWRKFLGKLGL